MYHHFFCYLLSGFLKLVESSRGACRSPLRLNHSVLVSGIRRRRCPPRRKLQKHDNSTDKFVRGQPCDDTAERIPFRSISDLLDTVYEIIAETATQLYFGRRLVRLTRRKRQTSPPCCHFSQRRKNKNKKSFARLQLRREISARE